MNYELIAFKHALNKIENLNMHLQFQKCVSHSIFIYKKNTN